MNWTGGALGRSRNAKASLTAIQRAHFAKARGRLQRPHIELPLSEIFGQPTAGAKGSDEDVNRPTRIQSDLDSTINFEKPWIDRHIQPTQHRKSIERQYSDLEPMGYHDGNRVLSPIVISSRPSSSLSSQHRSEDVARRARKRHPSPKPLGKASDSIPSAIEIQRARLLETYDWVGISHTKPAKVKFIDSSDRDQIGKRRRLNLDNAHSKNRKRRCSGQRRPEKGFMTASDHLSQADISVRIGSAVDRRSTRHERSTRSISRIDQVSSISDEMLLDDIYSHKSTSSHNPFRLPHASNNIYADQLSRHQGRALTPSAFMADPDDFQADHKIVQGRPERFGTNHDQTDPDKTTKDILHSPPVSEPLLVMRKPNGEHTPIRFTFDNTPKSLNEISHKKTPFSAKPESGDKQNIPGSEVQTVKKDLENTGEISALITKDGETLPNYFDTQQGADNRENLAHLDDLRRYGLGTAKQAQLSSLLKPNLSSRDMTVAEQALPLGFPTENGSTMNTGRVPTDEEEGWKQFINFNAPGNSILPVCSPPDGAALSLQKARMHAADTKPIDIETQDDQAGTDEDEMLWRSFVFGGDDLHQDWTFDTQTEVKMQSTGQSQITDDAGVRTQASMEAEVATSPIKKNAHLLEQSAGSSTPASKINKASQIALVSSTSQMTNSDDMLDSVHPQNRSSSPCNESSVADSGLAAPIHDPLTTASSDLAQLATSPLTTTGSQTRNTPADVPSSLVAQASTVQVMPAQPSSDELAWSPSRLSQATSKPAFVFKKPARYVGQRASEPVETIRLGVKGKSAKKAGQRKDPGGRSKTDIERAWQWDLSDEQDELQEDDEIEDD